MKKRLFPRGVYLAAFIVGLVIICNAWRLYRIIDVDICASYITGIIISVFSGLCYLLDVYIWH